MKRFVVSDSTLNSYGFRVLSDGGDLKRFKKNPVMLFNHLRDDVFQPNGYTGPIGRWENLKLNGDSWEADAVFDENDPIGKAVGSKVENGFLNAASVGIKILAVSDEDNLKLKGQTGPTVTKWELVEISVVDIPANKNALALYDADGAQIELKEDSIMATLSALLPKPDLQTTKNSDMKLKLMTAWVALSAFLGVKHADNTESTEAELSAEQLASLDAELATLNALKATNATLTADVAAAKAAQLTAETAVATLTAKVTELQSKLDLKPAETTKPLKDGEKVEAPGGNNNKSLSADMQERAARLAIQRKESGLYA